MTMAGVGDMVRNLQVNKKVLAISGAVLALFVLVVVVISALLGGAKPGERLVARVRVDGSEVLTIDLFEDGIITQNSDCVVQISKKRGDLYIDMNPMEVPVILRIKKDYRVRVERAGCKDQACVKAGFIGQLDQSVECVDNKLKVTIEKKIVI